MEMTRRTAIRLAGVAGVAIGTQALSGTAASAAPKPAARNPALTGKLSPNGWAIAKSSDAGGNVWTRPMAVNGVTAEVGVGDAELILGHVIRRFNYEVATLEQGDVVGFRKSAGLKGEELNHASGSAVDILPTFYPPEAKGGFFQHQIVAIRDILAECGGLVVWGGDFPTPYEAHFHIDAKPDDPQISAFASRLRGWSLTPGEGAGSTPDVNLPERRRASRLVESRQRA